VNITLIFAVARYEQVMDAYLAGLERRVQQGQPIQHISSVASFFVSRVDTLIDSLLNDRDRGPGDLGSKAARGLKGTIAIANAKIAYERFEHVFASPRFQSLRQHGGQIQRPLWASTGTKNPGYPDTLYVGELIGPNSVNTMPLETIDAFRDHGAVDCGAVTQGREQAHRHVEDLERAGISLTAATETLIQEGVDKFCQALHSLLDTIEQRQGSLTGA